MNESFNASLFETKSHSTIKQPNQAVTQYNKKNQNHRVQYMFS